ncbi:hypothetical protein [Desertihabitans aurantiacus]|uniref:hypothetical protein n=1 Tax=Desertihabitans aurantiacus TaxID=2282477 RepID=UPI000DF81283|nr:hypothetical protein [Desertihabitans aurantiacus]
MSLHRFRPPLPIRALSVAAGLAVAGAVLSVALTAATGNRWLAAPGLVLVALGAAMLVAAVVTTSRNRAEIELDDEGYRVRNRVGERSGRWRDVSKVVLAQSGDRITFVAKDGSHVHLVCPQGSVDALVGEVTTLLNRDRGYGRI